MSTISRSVTITKNKTKTGPTPIIKRENLDQDWIALEECLNQYEQKDPNWLSLLICRLIKVAMVSLQRLIDNPNEQNISWDNPWVEIQFSLEWDWSKKYNLSTQALAEQVTKIFSSSIKNLRVFQLLNPKATYKQDNKFFDLNSSTPLLDIIVENERKPLLLNLSEPITFRISSPQETSQNNSLISNFTIYEMLINFPDLIVKAKLNDQNLEVCIVTEFTPLVIDKDVQRAYYPVAIGLVLDDSNLSTLLTDSTLGFWQNLFNSLDVVINSLSTKQPIEPRTPVNQTFLQPEKKSINQPSHSSHLKLDKVVSLPLERRRSIMSPVPVPRTASKEAASLALIRGLGRMFTGYSKVPDLDILGKIASEEAERLFWPLLEKTISEFILNHNLNASWEKFQQDGKTILVLHGIQEHDCHTIWFLTTKAANKGEGGPGLEIADPCFKNCTQFIQGKVSIENRLIFWPNEAFKDRDGWDKPPIRFRTEGSPGYISLLERNGSQPYFADGWLWVPRGNEREGFRIGHLPTLLFPEGRAALERLKERELKDYEAEIQRIFQNPSLFRDEDSRTIRDLQSAVRRVKNWLRALSIYDIGHDLILCIFEAFYRQRNAWIAEKVILPNGQQIITKPWRIIRLDPDDLRLRLDPANSLGDNWRGRMFEKLEALTTFQRQTRTRTGRKIDVGDRFLGRVIDGRLGVDETSAPETDPGLGLTRVLKKSGVFPIDSFFVEVSLEFMERLVTWAMDADGTVYWGIDSAKVAERNSIISYPNKPLQAKTLKIAKIEEAKTKPYYDHSPRLLSLSNLECWPIERKLLACTLLQEVTPSLNKIQSKISQTTNKKINEKTDRKTNQETPDKYKLITLNSLTYISCNGSRDQGYQLKTWLDKVGYEKYARTITDKIFNKFIEDLHSLKQTLGLHLQLISPNNQLIQDSEALSTLETYKENFSSVQKYKLRFYLPADLEKRLRHRLADAGIDAVDEGEESAGNQYCIFTPLNPDGLCPADIRLARKRAGWKQTDLAQKLGVPREYIAYWENAKRPIPSERLPLLQQILKPFLSDLPEN